MSAVAATEPTIDSLHEIRSTLETVDLAYAQWCRETGKEILDTMALYAEGADVTLPDRETAAALGFGYSAQTALTELNGARVRILDVLDEVDTIPDGTDPAVNFAPVDTINRLRAALIAGVDLEIKINGYQQSAPSAWEQTRAEIKKGAGDVGDLVGGTLEAFLAKLATNLWWVVAALAVIFFFVYIKGPKVPVPA